MSETTDNPGAIVRPPLALLGVLIAGLILEWLRPLPFVPASVPRVWVGALLFAAGFALLVWAFRSFRAAGTLARGCRPADPGGPSCNLGNGTEAGNTPPWTFTVGPLGATLEVCGSTYDDAEAEARRRASDDQVFVSPFDDDHVIAGNGGLLAREVLAQLPDLEVVIAPVGGGGLAGGLGVELVPRGIECRVHGGRIGDLEGIGHAMSFTRRGASGKC